MGTILETLGGPTVCHHGEPLLTLRCQLPKHVDDQGLEDVVNLTTGLLIAIALVVLLVSCRILGVLVLLSQGREDAEVQTHGSTFVIGSNATSGRAAKPARWSKRLRDWANSV